MRLQTDVLLVAGDVAQFRQGFSLAMNFGTHVGQFLRVGIFQRVLKLRAADAVFDGEILHRLHEERDAFDLRQSAAGGG